MKKENLISLIVICITILLSAFMISKVDFSVNTWIAEHTITVDWNWEVKVTPDTLIISLRVEEMAKTTAEAQKQVDKKVEIIKDIIKKYKIKDSDVQTTNVNVYEVYDWTNSGRKSLWYNASHNLQIKVKSANLENEWIWGKIISEVSEIWWVLVDNVSYDIDDKSEYYSQARKLALEKSEQKAKDLAEYAWVKLWKPISIVESRNSDSYFMPMTNTLSKSFDDGMAEEDVTEISLWEMNISLSVNVVYEIK